MRCVYDLGRSWIRIARLTVRTIVVVGMATGGTTQSLAQTPPTSDQVRIVDAEDLLAERFGIDRRPQPREDAACDGGGGSGMRAKKYCNYVAEFRDVRVDKIISYKIGRLEESSVPTIYDRQRIGITNRWSNTSYEFNRTITYVTRQYVQVVLTDQLTKIKEVTTNLDIGATFFKVINVRDSTNTRSTVNVSLTQQESKGFEETITIQEPVKFEVLNRSGFAGGCLV